MKQFVLKGISATLLASSTLISNALAQPDEATTMKKTISILEFVGTVRITNTENSNFNYQNMSQSIEDVVRTSYDEITGAITIRGNQTRSPNNCIRSNSDLIMQFEQGAPLTLADLPILELAVPKDYELHLNMNGGDALLSEFRSVQLDLGRCVDLKLTSVEQSLTGSVKSGSSFAVDRVGAAVATDGALPIVVDLSLDRAARGSISLLNGTLKADLGRAAQLSVEEGRSDAANIKLDRAARVIHHGEIHALTLEAERASRMTLRKLSGELTASELSRRALTIAEPVSK